MSSRGSYFGPTNRTPVEIRDAAQKAAQDYSFDTQVNSLLEETLAELNQRDVEATRDRLDQIQASLGDALEERMDLLMGGSIAKRTYLEGLSDVDALILVPRSGLVDLGPEDIRRQFANALAERLNRSDVESIHEGRLAVNVIFRDGMKIQLLPATRSGDALRIPDSSGTRWSTIRPRIFAEMLSKANEGQAGRLVPTIKLAKLIITSFPVCRLFSGYHVESLAIDAFAGYDGPRTRKAMLQRFFSSAAGRVLEPIRDPTGQSVHVDADLGEPGGLARRLVSDSLARTARRIESSRSIDDWVRLIAPPEE